MKRIFLLSVFLHGSFTVLASAQADASPAVARLSLIQGSVSTQRGDTGEWSAAALNQPLVGGDRISTGDNSQAEVQLDHANILRLGDHAQVKLATVESRQIQVQVRQGVVFYTVADSSATEVEINTLNVAIRPKSKEGVYRIEVNGFDTQVIVRTGAVDVSTPQRTIHLDAGQAASVRGTTDEVGNVMGGAPPKDQWDSWNENRDSAIHNAQSWKHTNRYYVGSEDLDDYGRWVDVPDYGRVWSPTVAAGWVPYRAGRWLWEPYWGWTWISYEPWGWAPYHYGRWLLYRGSWMWWPGSVDGRDSYRPEWAPAYVSFFGLGAGPRNSTGFAFDAVGWLALGPADHFYPWYGQYGSHHTVVSIIDATNDTNANFGFNGVAPLRPGSHTSNLWLAANDERVRNAVLTLPASRFGTGRLAPSAANRAIFLDGYMMAGNLAIVPGKENLSATDRAPSPSSLTEVAPLERFFMKKRPAAPRSLDEQVAQLKGVMQGDALVIPASQTTEIDATRTAPPLTAEDAVERTVLPGKTTETADTSKPRPDALSRPTPPSQAATSRSVSLRRAPTPPSVSRVASPRTASSVARGPHATGSYRTSRSKSRSTRRTINVASGSRRVGARNSQVYVESASRQMDKGNYAAAIASYKRAWQVDRNNTAAKARAERAHRAMLAENKIIAARR